MRDAPVHPSLATTKGHWSENYAFDAQVAEVEVDTETGLVLWFGAVTSDASLYAAGVATGIFVVSVPVALHVVAGETYPTHIRSTGTGWAYAVGRVGSIAGPIIGGIIQMAGFSFGQFFALFSLPCFICMVLVAFYPVGVKKDALETVTAKLLK